MRDQSLVKHELFSALRSQPVSQDSSESCELFFWHTAAII